MLYLMKISSTYAHQVICYFLESLLLLFIALQLSKYLAYRKHPYNTIQYHRLLKRLAISFRFHKQDPYHPTDEGDTNKQGVMNKNQQI